MQKFSKFPRVFSAILALGISVTAHAQTAMAEGKVLPGAAVPATAAGSMRPGEKSAENPVRKSDQPNSDQSNAVESASEAQGTIFGSVIDFYGNEVPQAVVTVETIGVGKSQQVLADENGAFLINGLNPQETYRVHVHAQGYVDWSSDEIHVSPGQSVVLAKTGMKLAGDAVSVTVQGDNAVIATEQVELEVHQRVLGIIPNFYVVYDAEHAVPMTTKLKYKLALKVATDPMTMAGVGLLASVDQASNTPDYQQGMRGYGQRLGANAADGFSDIMIGGAILPSLLHQDPRYFYQGKGTNGSRFRHAISAPFICRADSGRREVNFSSMGGDLFSSALSNAYYPQSNRGYSLVFGNFAIGTAERVVSALAQEFVLSRFTSKSAE